MHVVVSGTGAHRILADYSSTTMTTSNTVLETLPTDLSGQFATLLGLDAHYTSSVNALTSEVNRLVDMLKSNACTTEQRLNLLMEVKSKLQLLKQGIESKFRAARDLADFIEAKKDELSAVLESGSFDRSLSSQNTVYPHVEVGSVGVSRSVGEARDKEQQSRCVLQARHDASSQIKFSERSLDEVDEAS